MPSVNKIPKKSSGKTGPGQNRLQSMSGGPRPKTGQTSQQTPSQLPGQKQNQQGTDNKNKNVGAPGQIANKLSGGEKGNAPSQIAKETGKMAMSLAMSIPDIVIMLPIAVLLDLASVFAFILSFIGVGFGLQYLISITGNIVLGFWVITSSMFRGITQKVISSIEGMVEGVGKDKSSQQAGGQGAALPGQQLAGKAGKKAISAGTDIVVWLVFSIPKLIPLFGSIWPGFTITVLRVMANRTIQGK